MRDLGLGSLGTWISQLRIIMLIFCGLIDKRDSQLDAGFILGIKDLNGV